MEEPFSELFWRLTSYGESPNSSDTSFRRQLWDEVQSKSFENEKPGVVFIFSVTQKFNK